MGKRLELTYTDALRLLEKAVADKGEDYVYPHYNDGCAYFEEAFRENAGQPSCIVGHVLSYGGITEEDLNGANMTGVRSLTGENSRCHVLDVDDETRELLRAAQAFQDAGMPWGHAVAEAQNPGWEPRYNAYVNRRV